MRELKRKQKVESRYIRKAVIDERRKMLRQEEFEQVDCDFYTASGKGQVRTRKGRGQRSGALS